MGRGHHTHIHLHLAGAADGVDCAFLQHAQQFDLHVQRHVTNFIEKDRAAVRQFKATNAVRHSARESTLAVAKQFAF